MPLLALDSSEPSGKRFLRQGSETQLFYAQFVPNLRVNYQQIGQDGFDLLAWTKEVDAPTWLRGVPAVEILRQI